MSGKTDRKNFAARNGLQYDAETDMIYTDVGGYPRICEPTGIAHALMPALDGYSVRDATGPELARIVELRVPSAFEVGLINHPDDPDYDPDQDDDEYIWNWGL